MKNRYRPVVFHGKHTQQYHCDATSTLLEYYRVGEEGYHPIHYSAGNARRAIDVLAEDERFLVDEYVAKHTSKCSCGGAHEYRHYLEYEEKLFGRFTELGEDIPEFLME